MEAPFQDSYLPPAHMQPQEQVQAAPVPAQAHHHVPPVASNPTKLFVGGISWETTNDGLHNYFAKFGHVVEAQVMRDKMTGRSRGFGFVVLGDDSAADHVCGMQHVLDGRTIEAKRAVPRETMARVGGQPTRKVFVGGLPPGLTEGEFRAFFERFGNVTDALMPLDKETHASRGFGFITYDSETCVEKLFAEGSSFEILGKMVDVKRAEPKRQPMGFGRGRGGGYGPPPYGGGYPPYGGNPYPPPPRYGGGYGRGRPAYDDYYGGPPAYGAPPPGAYGDPYAYGAAPPPRYAAPYGGMPAAPASPAAYGRYPPAAGGMGGVQAARPPARQDARYNPYAR